MRNDQAAIDRAIEIVQIVPLRNRRINQLSGGERERVHIARVIAQECPLMFFDEPDSDLDLIGTDQIDATLRSLDEAGQTLLISSYNLSWLSALATHVILMGDHKIVAAGPTREGLTQVLLSQADGRKINEHWPQETGRREMSICTSD